MLGFPNMFSQELQVLEALALDSVLTSSKFCSQTTVVWSFLYLRCCVGCSLACLILIVRVRHPYFTDEEAEDKTNA